MKYESITYVICSCSQLSGNQCRKGHDKVGKNVHSFLCKKFEIECVEKWYSHHLESVQENKSRGIFSIQEDTGLKHRKPNNAIIDKEKRNAKSSTH